MEASITRCSARVVTVHHEQGHEFEFEAAKPDLSPRMRLFRERWRNNRLPLNADGCRRAAEEVAEQRFRDIGLI